MAEPWFGTALTVTGRPASCGSSRRVRRPSDYPNLRAALTRSHEHGDTEAVARIAAALFLFWAYHGPNSEGETWLDAALAHVGSPANSPTKAKQPGYRTARPSPGCPGQTGTSRR
jgi:hypothetical protein